MPANVQLIGVYFRNLVDKFTSDSKGCWNTKLNLLFFFLFSAFIIPLCAVFLGACGLHRATCLKQDLDFQNTTQCNALGTLPDSSAVPAEHLLRL